jgi:hypothetical protein
MRTLCAVALILAVCPLAAANPDDAPRKRDRIYAAMSLIDELGLDETTSGKLFPVLSRYQQDRDRLRDEYEALTTQIDRASEPGTLDQLLDRALATQRAQIAVEAKLVVKLRQILPAAQAARARITLVAHAKPAEVPPLPPTHRRRSSDLFPPDSALAPPPPPCDPFAAMHGCSRLPF